MDPQNLPSIPAEPAQPDPVSQPSIPPPLPAAPAPFVAPDVPDSVDPVAPAPAPMSASAVPPVQPEPLSEPLQPPSAPVEPSSDAIRQQVVDRLKSANNVLVTVGSKPSVDELSSALGLTLQLDKLDKHATTVFSGEIPKAIEFLDPEATFENNVDSLRDFIIALDKEKADKLRYKVEDDVVRIFITPYKTKISEKDLQFSQGDFNVEVIVALGVVTRDDLDKAITAHGRILHDATVITLNAGGDISNLGEINWSDDGASSIAEMLIGVGDQLGSDLLDSQSSTAYLTGIVASTNRFSNDKTSPKVMNLAAQLMAAGANQQLIASNLRQDGVLTESINNPSDDHAENEVLLDHHKKKATDTKDEKPAEEDMVQSSEGNNGSDDDLPKPPDFPPKSPEVKPEVTSEPELAAEQVSEQKEADLELPADLKEQLGEAPAEAATPMEPEEKISDVKIDTAASQEPIVTPEPREPTDDQPAFNATMAQAEANNSTIEAPLGNIGGSAGSVADSLSPALPTLNDTPAAEGVQPTTDASADSAVDDARQAVEAVMGAADFNPANQPLESLGAQPLSELNNDLSSAPAAQLGAPELATPEAPVISGESAPTQESAVSSALPQAPAPDDNFLSGGLDKPEPSPMDSFMSAHQKPVIQPEAGVDVTPQPAAGPTSSDTLLPPMPPMPQATGDGTLPPLPPTPGQDVFQPTAQPALSPDVNPAFMQGMQPSQNQWTQAADDLAAKNATADANRQAKMDEMTQQYDQAVDRNLELQGQPPVNDPNGTGLPPLPPSPTV